MCTRFRQVKRGVLIGALAATTMFCGVSTASALPNGGFGEGDLSGWEYQAIQCDYSGGSATASGAVAPVEWWVYGPGSSTGEVFGNQVLPDPDGSHGAVFIQNSASWGILHRAFRVPRNARSLSVKLFWVNQGEAILPTSAPAPRKFTGVWRQPGGLVGCPATPSHQWAQVDLMRAGANPRSLKSADILKRIWRPRTGVTWFHSGGWKRPTVNLRSLRGKKVRLRIAVVDTRGYLNIGLDSAGLCC